MAKETGRIGWIDMMVDDAEGGVAAVCRA